MKTIRICLILSAAFLFASCSASEELDANVNSENSNSDSESSSDNNTVEVNSQIVDDENVTISLKSIVKESDDIFGDTVKVKFDVENKLDKTIEIQAREVSADNVMVDETILVMSQTVSSGKSAVAELQMMELDGYDLPTLEENIQLTLNVFDTETFEDVATYPVDVSLG